MEEYTPRITVFICRHVSKTTGGIQHNPALEYVVESCISRVDPQHVLISLKEGADGVLILGCPPASCRNKRGNIDALKRFTMLKEMLSDLKIDPRRVKTAFVSEPEKQEIMEREMIKEIKSIGPFRWESE